MANRAARTKREWRALVRERERSGEELVTFCNRHGVGVKQYRWWRWQLKRAGELGAKVLTTTPSKRKQSPRFIEVSPAEVPASSKVPAPHPGIQYTIEIESPRGYVVRAGVSTDAGRIAEVLRALEVQSC